MVLHGAQQREQGRGFCQVLVMSLLPTLLPTMPSLSLSPGVGPLPSDF